MAKRKHGVKRTKSGRISRAGVPRYDRGTERAQAMQALYGPNGSDAIGRAYQMGLLGDGSEAKALLDTGRNIAKAYWQAYETGTIRCTLGDRQSGAVISLDHEKIRRREEWLNDCLTTARKMGVRRQFDQLVIDVHPDSGPDWLDRLCWVQEQNRHRRGSEKLFWDKADSDMLRAALDALECLAS